MSDKDRAEFEAWKELPNNHFYSDFDVWQASAERYQSRIAEVKAKYEAEECVFDDQNLLADHAERYSLSMPDSHAKVVMHELAKLTSANLSRIAELEAEVVRLSSLLIGQSKWIREHAAPWLEEASEQISDWGQYAPVYFQEKHRLTGYVSCFLARAESCHRIADRHEQLSKIDEAMKGGA